MHIQIISIGNNIPENNSEAPLLGLAKSIYYVQQFQIPLEGLRFVKTLVTFGIICVTDPFVQKKVHRLENFQSNVFTYGVTREM